MQCFLQECDDSSLNEQELYKEVQSLNRRPL